MNESNGKRNYLNKSLDKSLSILELFDSENTELRVTEIARKCETNPSSLYPILHTLEKYGYLNRDKDKRYRLGLAFAKKGRLVMDRLSLTTEAKSEIKKLRDKAKRTVHLGFLSETQIVYIDKVESNSGFRMYSSPGKTAPLHATALGKVILAHLPKARLDDLIGKLDLSPHTKHTITSVEELREELTHIRRMGYAVDKEEFEEGVKCIAAPIHRHDGEVDAAVSLTGLAAQMSEEVIEQKAKLVMNYAGNISSKLGYSEEQSKHRSPGNGFSPADY
ncbi:IclR family transcriptional regulator [Candidatus Bipolaricaulota bacterium]|nr:IclR family transcriptional regulator [Candidatus Bipolaricaulota bacterium]